MFFRWIYFCFCDSLCSKKICITLVVKMVARLFDLWTVNCDNRQALKQKIFELCGEKQMEKEKHAKWKSVKQTRRRRNAQIKLKIIYLSFSEFRLFLSRISTNCSRLICFLYRRGLHLNSWILFQFMSRKRSKKHHINRMKMECKV